MVKITLSIEGMMCAMCEAHMTDAIRKNFKVKKVTSSSADKQTVIISTSELDRDKLEKTVTDAGYKLLSVTTAPYAKKSLFSFKSKD